MLLLCLMLPALAAERATLYINDTAWEEDSILPFIETEGKMLVPALAFARLGSLTVLQSDRLGSLLIDGGDKFLSYNLSFGTYLDEGGNIAKCEIFRYGGQIYLEPSTVCEKFNLKFETQFAPDGYLAARLCDGSETIDFHALLSSYTEESKVKIPYLYNPTGKTVAGTFVHPILLVPSLNNVKAAISILGANGVSFAVAPSEITQYSEVIPAIYANGHNLVYYMESDADTALFKEQLESANKYLFSLVGKTSRIYVCAESYEKIPKIDGYFAKSCRLHLVVDDLKTDVMVLAALYYSPNSGSYNFSLASDRATRNHYRYFFQRLASFNSLRSMPLTESSSIK